MPLPMNTLSDTPGEERGSRDCKTQDSTLSQDAGADETACGTLNAPEREGVTGIGGMTFGKDPNTDGEPMVELPRPNEPGT